MATDYNLLGSTEVLEELQEGRTRELLLLLQDKPVPEVQDPLNLQSGLSDKYEQSGNDYQLDDGNIELIADFEDGSIVPTNSDWEWRIGNATLTSTSPIYGSYSALISSADTNVADDLQTFSSYNKDFSCSIEIDNQTGDGGDRIDLELNRSETLIEFEGDGTIRSRNDDTGESWSANTTYDILFELDFANNTYDIYLNGSFIYNDSFSESDVNAMNFLNYTGMSGQTVELRIDNAELRGTPTKLDGYVTDQFAAPTTEPTDFKQWNAIRAEDVTTGGSTSADPVEFDLTRGGVIRSSDGASQSASTKRGVKIEPTKPVSNVKIYLSDSTSGATTAYISKDDGTFISQTSISGNSAKFSDISLQSSNKYHLQVDADGSSFTAGYSSSETNPVQGTGINMADGLYEGDNVGNLWCIKEVLIGYNSTRIPKARIADEPFTMRNRVYSEDAGSDGQSDYQIATTGDGGHFEIPVLTVVSVKKNGSVLDSANWSFDGNTTVTIDTSNVSIASGDTIDIKYDFDVFDSTLQPRAYLNRESSSETSPSISHFRYEYVI